MSTGYDEHLPKQTFKVFPSCAVVFPHFIATQVRKIFPQITAPVFSIYIYSYLVIFVLSKVSGYLQYTNTNHVKIIKLAPFVSPN